MPRPSIGSKGLKQKLATLSASSPALASSPVSISPPKRSIFGNWGLRRGSVDFAALRQQQQEDADTAMENLMSKVIFQAGLDFETRPMVVITAAALPDPAHVSYDELLSYILSYLDLYVESDYVIVFLAAGGKFSPGWSWVWKAYRRLERKYRKNLKQLYIVHPSWFTKMLFSLAGAVISPKFFRKINYIHTLSELARSVPITQIDIHSAVYQENLRHETEIVLPQNERQKVFGVSLHELMGEQLPPQLPTVIKDCVAYLRSRGLEEEGLFRRSPNSVKLKQAQQAYDRGHPVSLESFGDPNIAAVLIKKFFHDLPQPIFPEKLYPQIKACPFPGDEASEIVAIQYVRTFIYDELDIRERELLSFVLHLLHDISIRSATNLMNAYNLALVFSPNLLASGKNPMREVELCMIPGGPNLSHPTPGSPTKNDKSKVPAPGSEGSTTLGSIIQLCIKRYFEIFDEENHAGAVAPAWSADEFDRMTGTSNGGGSSNDDEMDESMLIVNADSSAATPSTSMASSLGAVAASPPSAWNQGTNAMRTRGKRAPPPPPSNPSTSGSRASSVREGRSSISREGGNGTKKPRSIISIERAVDKNGGRGSITVGRGMAGGGTTKKAHGAAVTAMSVTAAGFFSPPPEPYMDDQQHSK